MSGFSEIWNPGCWRGGWGVGVGVRRFSLTSWSWLRHWQTLSSIQASLQSPTWTGQFRHHARSVSCKLFRLWRDCVTTKKVPSPRPSLSLFDVRLLSYSRNKSRIGRRIYGAKELKLEKTSSEVRTLPLLQVRRCCRVVGEEWGLDSTPCHQLTGRLHPKRTLQFFRLEVYNRVGISLAWLTRIQHFENTLNKRV